MRKSENFPRWYTQVLTKAELLDYHSVYGCYILRPWAYSIWEAIQSFLNAEFRKMGVMNCYFPMLITADALEQEEVHITNFRPEVTWVTMVGTTTLPKPIAIRPTSETAIYPTFSKWCQSQKSLPIKINQWCNIVRWETQNPIPFLRSREFLWQEGHTAFATKEEAENDMQMVIDLYTRFYNELLAIPVVTGTKSAKEKFPGADFTMTVEAYVPSNGRAIQAATSHHFGQNFSKLFDISYVAGIKKSGIKEYAWQNSWGLSTRSIGALIMIHGDDIGLVLPPKIAPIQVIVLPVGISSMGNERQQIFDKINEIVKILRKNGDLRVESDLKDVYPGKKYFHWERKGVPIRLEVGPKEMKQNQVLAVLRHNGEKRTIEFDELSAEIRKMLDEIHVEMYKKIGQQLAEHTRICLDWREFTGLLDRKMLLLSPFCGQPGCETSIKNKSIRPIEEFGISSMGAKVLCIPTEQPKEISLSEHCINPECKDKALYFALFGRSY